VRAIVRVFIGSVVALCALTVATPTAFAATTITEPSGLVTVGVAADGYPAPVTVSAKGFDPYESVFVEQCNGRTPEDDNWSAQVDCDPGSAPAAAIADANGVATFSATDRNHAFRPFVGPSPQGSFNCLGPSAPEPNNHVDSFRNCQIRVSSTNSQSTADQAFVRLKLPNNAKPWDPSIVPGVVAAAGAKSGSGAGAAGAGSSAKHGSSSGDSAAPAGSKSS